MHAPTIHKSRSLLGANDLTLIAPIKPGLVLAPDARSYTTRLKVLLRTLHAARVRSKEAEKLPAIADVVDDIRAIRAFRLAVVGPEQNQLLLSVAFDGPWEPYMRQIWRDLGPLLDVILCNCEGYLLSHEHSYADYVAWVRSAQVGTEYFYEASLLTVSDMHVLRDRERARWETVPKPSTPPSRDDAIEQGLPGLVALFGLTDLYPPQPGHSDGSVLWRAARLLLRDLVHHGGVGMPPQARNPSQKAAWRWLFTYHGAAARAPLADAPTDQVLAQAQGGVLQALPAVTHGALVLLSLADAAAAQALLATLRPMVTTARAAQQTVAPGVAGRHCFHTLAFTFAGLQRCGLGPGQAEELPVDFREGMAARCGTLGDWDHNHPSRWVLPRHRLAGQGGPDRVHLAGVHAVLQLHLQQQASDDWNDSTSQHARDTLAAEVSRIEAAIAQRESAADRQRRGPGVQVLAIEPLQRMAARAGALPQGHFGYVDGISQPHTALGGATPYSAPQDEVPLGDLLLGHGNGLHDDPHRGALWVNGSFLVVRKLRQDVAAWHQALQQAPSADRTAIESQMMGRTPAGANLITGQVDNDFDYGGDPDGQRCPFHAHVRRANPRRTDRPDLRHLPRIARRGLSYGPRLAPGQSDDGQERGLMFMAYNASISEQFELIQAWLAGGNSADANRSFSGQRDPFVGVRQPGDPDTLPYRNPQGEPAVFQLPQQPLVTLAWGLYLFTPAVDALLELERLARQAAEDDALGPWPTPQPSSPTNAAPGPAQPAAAERRRLALQSRWARESAVGAALITRLKAAESTLGSAGAVDRWKGLLEDAGASQTGMTQALWTAVRQTQGGCLRTPYGVLVGSAALVDQVLQDSDQRYSVSGYAARMAKSFGPIYLGMDPGPAYHQAAEPTNSFIMALRLEDGFRTARRHTQAALTQLTLAPEAPGNPVTVQVRDLVDEVLARISRDWFGLPDDQHVEAAGWRWQAHEPASCPGHFHAPSRYMFWPQPGPASEQLGQRHGQVLRRQVLAFVRQQRTRPQPACGELGNRMLAAIHDDDQMASTLIGVMMGFLPTVDGNVRGVLAEWIQDDSLWALQQRYLTTLQTADGPTTPPAMERHHGAAARTLAPALVRSLQRHPVPPLLWRTAVQAHTLGSVQVQAGDRIVVGLGSATAERLDRQQADPYTVFGGWRSPAPNTGPAHACPGRLVATGVMLGLLAGLMERADLRPGGSASSLAFTGRAEPDTTACA